MIIPVLSVYTVKFAALSKADSEDVSFIRGLRAWTRFFLVKAMHLILSVLIKRGTTVSNYDVCSFS